MRREDIHRTQRQIAVILAPRIILAVSAIAAVVGCADRSTEPVSRALRDSTEARLAIISRTASVMQTSSWAIPRFSFR